MGTFNQDLYLGMLPLDAPDEAWLVVVAGGSPELVTADGGMMKIYTFSIYRRSLAGKEIERSLFSLEEKLNCSTWCKPRGIRNNLLTGNTVRTDMDLENENRRIGLLQAQVPSV